MSNQKPALEILQLNGLKYTNWFTYNTNDRFDLLAKENPSCIEKRSFDRKSKLFQIKINDLNLFNVFANKNGFRVRVNPFRPQMCIESRYEEPSYAYVTFDYNAKCVCAIKEACSYKQFFPETASWKIKADDIDQLYNIAKTKYAIDIVFTKSDEIDEELLALDSSLDGSFEQKRCSTPVQNANILSDKLYALQDITNIKKEKAVTKMKSAKKTATKYSPYSNIIGENKENDIPVFK